jgi:hypothetical protein
MAARINKIKHDEGTRLKIKGAYLINRLQDFIAGNVKLEAAQVTAALGLLKKVLPDQQSAQHTVEITKTYVHRTPAPAKTTEEWATQHAPTIQ